MNNKDNLFAQVPMEFIGPVKISSQELTGEFKVPMATFETPLWPSCNRGAKVSRLTNEGISVVIVKDNMTRSILLQALNAKYLENVLVDLRKRFKEISIIAAKNSKFVSLQEWHEQIVGNLIYLRFSFDTKDASGHNMATLDAENILNWLIVEYPQLKHVSISGNYCTDKKVSAVNGILGRGKYVVAEIIIPRDIVVNVLNSTPEKITELNIKKNLIGGILAGSLRSANAHFANMLLAIYLATGQDAANIIEGSQGIVHAEVVEESLYFSVTLPNLIVGTVGNGKDLSFVQKNFKGMGCDNLNSRRLAIIVASSVLCGELSLLAAQTNPGELMRTHFNFERSKQGIK